MAQIRSRVGYSRSTKGQVQVESTFEIIDELGDEDVALSPHRNQLEGMRCLSDAVRAQAKRQMEKACEDFPFDPSI